MQGEQCPSAFLTANGEKGWKHVKGFHPQRGVGAWTTHHPPPSFASNPEEGPGPTSPQAAAPPSSCWRARSSRGWPSWPEVPCPMPLFPLAPTRHIFLSPTSLGPKLGAAQWESRALDNHGPQIQKLLANWFSKTGLLTLSNLVLRQFLQGGGN